MTVGSHRCSSPHLHGRRSVISLRRRRAARERRPCVTGRSYRCGGGGGVGSRVAAFVVLLSPSASVSSSSTWRAASSSTEHLHGTAHAAQAHRALQADRGTRRRRPCQATRLRRATPTLVHGLTLLCERCRLPAMRRAAAITRVPARMTPSWPSPCPTARAGS